jgi:hypothetical protein
MVNRRFQIYHNAGQYNYCKVRLNGATVAPQAIRSSRGTVFIALSLPSGFTVENEVTARVGELYLNNGGVCGRLTLKAKSQRDKFI